MSEPENFLSRWSRKKREAEAAPDDEKPAAAETVKQPPDAAAAAVPAEEPAFDLSELPSLDDIAADTDIASFMKPGVPAALRHAALRRAWASDPAIRDFRGLQENGWDFNAPDSVPGFGTFKSDEEIKALAQRLFGPDRPDDLPVPQSAPQDSTAAPVAEPAVRDDERLDKCQEVPTRAHGPVPDRGSATATPPDQDGAMQRASARRHGGALPQ
jgi:hypothetical protein